MTLESQYEQFMKQNPDSKFTFEERKKWLGKNLSEAIKKLEDERDK